MRVLRAWLLPAHEVPRWDQSTVVRARLDTAHWIEARPIRFNFMTTAAGAAATVVAAVLTAQLTLAVQCLVSVGAACVGLTLTLTVVFVTQLALAAPRQRDEARAELHHLNEPNDLESFAQDFMTAARAMHVSLPNYGPRLVPSLFDQNPQARIEQEKRADELERQHAAARGEYQRRFRQTVVSVLGSEAESPKGIAEILQLAERLVETVGEPGRTERIIDAAGQPVGGRQHGLLENLCDSAQLCVANDRLIDYGDVSADAPTNEAAFRAHFTDLLPALADWQRAVQQRDQAVEALEAWIPNEITRRGLADCPFTRGAVAECFTEISVGRALRRERNEPSEIHLRCVQESPSEPALWTAYLHSGRREIRAAELSQPMGEFCEEHMAKFLRRTAELDRRLQACFYAIQESEAAISVTAAQDAVSTLQLPLRSQLQRWKVTAHLEFAVDCPYCLDELGLSPHTRQTTTDIRRSG